MNKIKVIYISLILLIVLTVSLASFGLLYPREYREYLSSLKSKANNLLYEYKDFEDELPVVICEDETNHVNNISYIYKDEALEDIEYLFSLLKYGYAGYEYFGGDSSFNKAKANIIWSVRAINGSDVDIKDLLNIIYTELGFIQDAHFTIGNHILCEYTKYYSSRKFTFHKDDYGLYTFIDDEIYYLTQVNNEEP